MKLLAEERPTISNAFSRLNRVFQFVLEVLKIAEAAKNKSHVGAVPDDVSALHLRYFFKRRHLIRDHKADRILVINLH